ncbi:hypothetical protein [Marinobacter confluentis]|uniref:Cadherin domain-containing protein n=1 Tax=Marinobacter confluentis TaxID=1697557 RepID=A0A4Z1BG45_9GAMM|nr:hypothetical protein [Marinobacter confluentis]TGN41754.1 hypothetical protein E5Q11_04310 [Marinobacter confluentis]
MRADSCSLTFSRLSSSMTPAATLLMLLFLLSGCKTEQDSEDPVIIGVPPEDAYLGVEYAYNFGATDKDNILDYSLTNAPSWLALEGLNNDARQGIIMRGVPGITGGQRGRDDLGRTTRINLVGNDRDTLGAQPFSIEVQENQLSVVSQDYSEAPPEADENDGDGEGDGNEEEEKPDFQCERPYVGEPGEHTYSVNLYDDEGAFTETSEKTSVTRPVLVQVNLDQPSVTRIKVAFELRSNFDPNRCDKGFSPTHQRCDAGLANSDEAIIGRDIVALGSGSAPALPGPEYVEYQQDADGLYTKGVLTLEPGITECYVRLEVIDDLEPERLEAFRFALTEVRSGIAGLGPSNGGVREPLRIEDNEPTVSLQTERGGKRDVINLGSATDYVARIEGDREEIYHAKISAQEGSDAVQGTDFFLKLETSPGSDVWEEADLIDFPVGTDEVSFRVETPDAGSYTNDEANDRFVLLGLDTHYQAGRNNHAAALPDNELRININELDGLPQVGSQTDFVPTDMAMGQNGRLFLVGYDTSTGDEPVVRVFDQKGNLVTEKTLFAGGISRDAPPVIATGEREIEIGGEDVQRYEFAVAFGAETDSDGSPTPGNINIISQRWFFDTALAPADYAQDWQLVSGSDQDDLPRWVGIAPNSGNVLVSGVTLGILEAGDTLNGRFGSFIQRIDTQQDGAALVPEVAWTRKVESVSHDERVVGGGIQNSAPIVIGDTSGSVEGESQFGGRDAFFYSALRADGDIDVQQAGTGADENLADGFFSVGNVWLVGNSNGNYRVTTEQGVKVLRRDATASAAGFLLGYTSAGSAAEAYLINDDGDQSEEELRAAMIFDGDLVAAGSTTGVLTDNAAVQSNTLADPAIFRRDRQPERDDDDSVIDNPAFQWDQQIAVDDPGTGVIEALVNYRDDEITALVKRQTGSETVWTLNLFSAEGDPVNTSP